MVPSTKLQIKPGVNNMEMILSEQIKEAFQNIIDHCLAYDDSLINLSFSAVKSSLVKNAEAKEMAQIAKLCGILEGLFLLSKKLNLNFNNKIKSLEQWCGLCDHYINSKFPVLYKGKKDDAVA